MRAASCETRPFVCGKRRVFRAGILPDARGILTEGAEFFLPAGKAGFSQIEVALNAAQSFVVDLLRVT
jgi:hypothetical protein